MPSFFFFFSLFFSFKRGGLKTARYILEHCFQDPFDFGWEKKKTRGGGKNNKNNNNKKKKRKKKKKKISTHFISSKNTLTVWLLFLRVVLWSMYVRSYMWWRG